MSDERMSEEQMSNEQMSNEQMSKFPALAKIYQKILRHWHFKNLVFCLQLSVIGHFLKVMFHRICWNENLSIALSNLMTHSL